MTKKQILLLCFVPLFLSACASDDAAKVERQCPQVAIVRSLERIEDYGSDTVDPSNLVGTGVMQKVEGKCEYVENGVEVAFDLTMVAEKGPRLGGEKINFPFFISLVSPEDKVVGKEIMTAEFTFAEEAKNANFTQSVRVLMPLKEGENAGHFRVLAGYQLTEAQIKAQK